MLVHFFAYQNFKTNTYKLFINNFIFIDQNIPYSCLLRNIKLKMYVGIFNRVTRKYYSI